MGFCLLLLHLPPLPFSSPAATAMLLEYKALISLKSAISDDPQSSLSSWNLCTSHCKWAGVTCDFKRHVIALDVSGFNLTRTLSPYVRSLRNLVNFIVDNIAGPIPPEISFISGLLVLNLSNNVFSDTFPSELTNLKFLQVLDLYNNNLFKDLPVEVSEMPNLLHLHLGGNYFSGGIPVEYGKFAALEYLAVSGNELTGAIPPEIGNITNLKHLYLGYYNIYTGGTQPEIGNLSKLIRLECIIVCRTHDVKIWKRV